MRNLLISLFCVLSLLTLPMISFADETTGRGGTLPSYEEEESSFFDDVGFGVRTELGYTYYILDLDNNTTGFGDAIVQDYGDLTFGATVTKERFNFDVYGRFAIVQGTSQIEFDQTGINQEANTDRYEIGGVFSVSLTEHWGGYVGFRHGSTESGSTTFSVFNTTNSFEFDVNGPTAGIGYNHFSDNKKHNFSFMGGLGYMMGDLKLNSLAAGGGAGPGSVSGEAEALGYTLQARYRYAINDHWDLRLTADGYGFDFGQLLASNGDNIDLLESSASVRFGINYAF